MLDYIRRNSDSPVVKIILGVLSLTFVFFFGSSALFGDRTEVWAEVNGEPIRDVEVTQVVRNRVRQQQQFNPNLGDEDIARIQQQVLDQMIEQRLMLQAAKREGFVISDKELRRKIMENPSFQDDEGNFDAERYHRKIMERNNASTYERDVRESLLVQSMQDFIRRSARVSEAEVKEAFVEEASKRDVEFIRVPTALFKDSVVVSDEEATTWAVEHDAEVTDRYDRDYETKYNLAKKVGARHILMKYDEDGGDDDKAAVREKMESVLAEATAGGDFEQLAAKYSEDGSASRGGDLGLFDDKRMVKPFTDAAFSMAVGDISGLVETQYGLHIILVTEIQEAEVKELDSVKLAIARELMKDVKAPELARAHALSLIPVLTGAAAEEADALLKEKSLTVQSSGEFSRKDRRIPKLGTSKDALKAAFALAAPGDVTDEPVDLGTGYAIIKLTTATDADLDSFEEMKEEIRGRLVRTKQVRAVTAWRDQLKAEAKIRIAGGV